MSIWGKRVDGWVSGHGIGSQGSGQPSTQEQAMRLLYFVLAVVIVLAVGFIAASGQDYLSGPG